MSSGILDLTGQRFGKLTALFRLPETENRYHLWECICDCGGRTQVSTKKLKCGIVTNCGCIPKNTRQFGTRAEDITGQRFGKLTAISRVENQNGKTAWLCICDCGKTKVVRTAMLKNGRTYHCGCEIRYNNNSQLDLTGRKFGRLIALEATEKRDKKGSVVWICRCECGNTVEITADSLVHGNTISCGCRKQEIKDSIGDKLTFVDGTCIEWLRSRKHRCDNTSGFRGVYKTKNGKWRVTIGLKGKQYNCGSYDFFEEAVAARLKVEKVLHDDFVLAWDIWKRNAEADPDWALENPFIFEIYRVNGNYISYAPILYGDPQS